MNSLHKYSKLFCGMCKPPTAIVLMRYAMMSIKLETNQTTGQ